MTARIYDFPQPDAQLALFSREECGATTPPRHPTVERQANGRLYIQIPRKRYTVRASVDDGEGEQLLGELAEALYPPKRAA